jgi:hypothetical protein
MKKIYKYHIRNVIAGLSFLSLIAAGSCKKESVDFTGPAVIATSETFAVTANTFSATAPVAFFSGGPINFTSSFNEEVSWKITITGPLSGAKKEIRGTSDIVDASNSTWTGESDNGYFFRKTEICTAIISFTGSTFTLSTTVKVGMPKAYDGLIENGITYTLIDDFDTRGVAMTSVSKDQFDHPVTMALDTTIKCQGKFSYHMSGLDLNGNSWCGGINHTNLVEIYSAGKTPLITDPSKFYINMYIYGTGKANSAIEIKVYEVDDETNLSNIPAYVYEQNKNDAWLVDLPITWTGWKLVTLNYANFIPAKDPLAGGGGNKIREPNKITGLGLSLLSLPGPGASVEAYVDMVTFTQDGVFRP